MFARGFFVAKHGLPITVFQHLREHDKLSARLLGGPEAESRVKDRVRTEEDVNEVIRAHCTVLEQEIGRAGAEPVRVIKLRCYFCSEGPGGTA